MKKIRRFCILLMTLAFSLASFSSCLLVGGMIENAVNKSDEAFELASELTLEWSYNEEYAMYDVAVDGILQNVTDKDWNGVNVTLMLFDKDGNGIGSATDFIEYVSANGTWRFCATAMTKYEPSTVRFHEVNAYGSDLLY